ncbi:MAG: hypothetical protein OCD02_11260 [Spirochaetaceae bacterium]
MILINPENSYSNNIAGKVGPVINKSYLSTDVCNWLTNLLSSFYEDNLDEAMIIANFNNILGGDNTIPENYKLFLLFCAVKGLIKSPNHPFSENEHLANNIFQYLNESYNTDFNSFAYTLIIEERKRKNENRLPIFINSLNIAIYLYSQKLIDYRNFIKLENISNTFYKLCSHRNYWTFEDFTIDTDIYDQLLDWGFWLRVLREVLPEDEFNRVYDVVDLTFLNNYLINEQGNTLFHYTEAYISNVLNVADYQVDRHLIDPEYIWLFKKQIKYFNILHDQFNRIKFNNDNLRVLLKVSHIAYRSNPQQLPEEIKKELLFQSKKNIGNYRSMLKDANTTAVSYKTNMDTVNEAINFIAYFESPSKAVIQLIQLLRNFEGISINDDLTFEYIKQFDMPFAMPFNSQQFYDQEPPQNNNWIISKIEWIITTFFEFNDSDIDQARKELTKFFGSRLKTNKKTKSPRDKDFIEPDSIWRVVYVCCIRALHCNPGGKFHQILYFSCNHDSSEDVRTEASKAYKEIRHNNPLPSDMERVLTLRRVFWYLRQAYNVSLLGIDKLDTRGAQRTYSKEVERCKARMKK